MCSAPTASLRPTVGAPLASEASGQVIPEGVIAAIDAVEPPERLGLLLYAAEAELDAGNIARATTLAERIHELAPAAIASQADPERGRSQANVAMLLCRLGKQAEGASYLRDWVTPPRSSDPDLGDFVAATVHFYFGGTPPLATLVRCGLRDEAMAYVKSLGKGSTTEREEAAYAAVAIDDWVLADAMLAIGGTDRTAIGALTGASERSREAGRVVDAQQLVPRLEMQLQTAPSRDAFSLIDELAQLEQAANHPEGARRALDKGWKILSAPRAQDDKLDLGDLAKWAETHTAIGYAEPIPRIIDRALEVPIDEGGNSVVSDCTALLEAAIGAGLTDKVDSILDLLKAPEHRADLALFAAVATAEMGNRQLALDYLHRTDQAPAEWAMSMTRYQLAEAWAAVGECDKALDLVKQGYWNGKYDGMVFGAWPAMRAAQRACARAGKHEVAEQIADLHGMREAAWESLAAEYSMLGDRDRTQRAMAKAAAIRAGKYGCNDRFVSGTREWLGLTAWYGRPQNWLEQAEYWLTHYSYMLDDTRSDFLRTTVEGLVRNGQTDTVDKFRAFVIEHARFKDAQTRAEALLAMFPRLPKTGIGQLVHAASDPFGGKVRTDKDQLQFPAELPFKFCPIEKLTEAGTEAQVGFDFGGGPAPTTSGVDLFAIPELILPVGEPTEIAYANERVYDLELEDVPGFSAWRADHTTLVVMPSGSGTAYLRVTDRDCGTHLVRLIAK